MQPDSDRRQAGPPKMKIRVESLPAAVHTGKNSPGSTVMSMEEEGLQPKAPEPKDLEPMSIEQLEDYIAEMKAEIARVEEAIAAKKDIRVGAEALFRK